MVYYNSAILPRLLMGLAAEWHAKDIEAPIRVSLVVWQYMLLNGNYICQSGNGLICLDALVAALTLG